MSEMLKIENIRKVFNPGTINEKVALDGVDLTLEEGEFATVIGGNGAGKSTTLNAVAGVWPVDSGKIYIGGEDVTKLSEHRRAQYLGRVFQDPMTGTATTMSIEEKYGNCSKTWKIQGIAMGNYQSGTREIPPNAFHPASWTGRSPDIKSRSVIRWTASGNHASDGFHPETEASASR